MKEKSTEEKLRFNSDGYISSESANSLEGFQIHKYRPEKGGHGFAAEDANAFSDKIRLKKVEITGTSNEENGPDRIVNGTPIQTKYHDSAFGTVSSAFDRDTGVFRYKGQMLEVPKDQYDECVKIMKEKIAQGKVEGITKPEDAEKIIKSGNVTYKQARNIARAGNIDSIIFDAKTQAVTSAYVFAISFAINYAQNRWNGTENGEVLKSAIKSSIAASGTTLITGVITAQILRTRAAHIGAVAVRSGVKSVYHISIGKNIIDNLATASLGKAVSGAAAFNHVSRLLRSNVITSTVVTAVTAAPDFYRAALSKHISWSQFAKNLMVNVSGVATGTVGWMGGSAAGAAIGTAIFPGVGTTVGAVTGGILGAFGIGTAGSVAAKKLTDRLIEDDAKKMIDIVQEKTEEVASEYMLTEKEVETLASLLRKEISPKWLMQMYKAGSKSNNDSDRANFASEVIEGICFDIIKQRPMIYLPDIREVQTEIDKIVEAVDAVEA